MRFVVDVALATLCALNLALSVGIIRYVKRVFATADASREPLVGRRVRTFDVPDLAGGRATEALLTRGRALLILLSAHCDACHQVADALLDQAAPPVNATLVVVQSDVADPLIALRLVGRFRTVVDEPHGHAIGCVGDVDAFPTVLELNDGEVVSASFRLPTWAQTGFES